MSEKTIRRLIDFGGACVLAMISLAIALAVSQRHSQTQLTSTLQQQLQRAVQWIDANFESMRIDAVGDSMPSADHVATVRRPLPAIDDQASIEPVDSLPIANSVPWASIDLFGEAWWLRNGDHPQTLRFWWARPSRTSQSDPTVELFQRVILLPPLIGTMSQLDYVNQSKHQIRLSGDSADPIPELAIQDLMRGGSGIRARRSWFGISQLAIWRWNRDRQMGLVLQRQIGPLLTPQAAILAVLMTGLISIPGGMLLRHLASTLAARGSQRILLSPQDPSDLTINTLLGRTFDGLTLVEVLGTGVTATVYRAHQPGLDRDVAVKVIDPAGMSSHARMRFEREKRLLSRLHHPNTIAIFGFGEAFGFPYYVMPWIDGMTLDQLVVESGPQSPAKTIQILMQICGSIGEAHRIGLIHRDIKPANIMIEGNDNAADLVKVLDFGLIKDLNQNDAAITRFDSITGTPMYMSPEAVRDASTAGTASDIYSIAAVGYTLITGRPLFDAGSSMEVCVKQLQEQPLSPSDRLGRPVPMDLQAVIMRGLEKDIANRYASVVEMANDLQRCVETVVVAM